MLIVGRERELSEKMPRWHRLFSYYYLDWIYKSEILNIVETIGTEYEDLPCHNRSGE